MKWFQMRIMHRITETNVILNEMGVTNNNKCSLCRISKDTIQHIFWECAHIQFQQLQTRFLVMLHEKCTSCNRLRLSECLILFGIDDERMFLNLLFSRKQNKKGLQSIHVYNLKPVWSLGMHLPFVIQYVLSFHVYITYEMLNTAMPHVLKCPMHVSL